LDETGYARAVHLAGIVLSESTPVRRRKLPRHDHAGPFFCLLVSGRYEERLAGRTLSYEPGGVAFHPAGLRHADDLFAGSRLFGVELAPRYQAALDDLPARPGPCLHGAGAEAAWLAARVRAEWRRGDPCAALAIEGLVLEMLAAAGRAAQRRPGAAPPWVARALELVRADFARALTVARIARAVGAPPAHLATAFRRHQGVTLAGAVRRRRVEAACARLADPDVALADVAAETGFADQSHLTRVFKRVTGTTPGAYRRARLARR
jgi:AraC-like DNA-binding protein